MDKKMKIAIGIQLAIMVLVLVPPLLLKATGTVVYLETEKMDPRGLFRGDYVILGYKVAQDIITQSMADESNRTGKPVYVTVTTDRPAQFVSVGLDKPSLGSNEACIVGRVRNVWWGRGTDENGDADFPQIAQFFVPEGEGRELEQARGENLLAKVSTSGSCNAVLLGLEER